MLRVVKVTSPMNLGSWVLLVNGGATTTAAVCQLLDRWKPLRIAASIVAALAGPPLATYTGVLIADTAVPVWHDGRHELPWIFGASAAASAGASAAMFVDPVDAGPARRVAIAGVLAEGALMQTMELRLRTVGEVYHQGAAGKLSWAAKGLSVAGAALLGTRGRKSRASAVLGGALVCAGELCLRWAVFKAGFQSARDPKYVVDSQRQRVEQRGTKATTKPGESPGSPSRGT
jgi:formate-dependent nitrite reductase membrane component NrfD